MIGAVVRLILITASMMARIPIRVFLAEAVYLSILDMAFLAVVLRMLAAALPVLGVLSTQVGA